jgi:hypothetical protein
VPLEGIKLKELSVQISTASSSTLGILSILGTFSEFSNYGGNDEHREK